MIQLTHDRYCAELDAEAAKLADAVRGADLTRQVPTCPEWTLDQLTTHVGRFHRWAAAIVARRATEAVGFDELTDTEPPEGAAERSAWLSDGVAQLVRELRDAGPQAPAWTYTDDQRAEFWARRAVHETAVHRSDIELTLGRDFESPAEVAADGISEWLGLIALPQAETFNPSLAELRGNGETLHFHVTDGDLGSQGEWLVRRTPSGVSWEHGHAKADVAVRGPAAVLLLVILRRLPPNDPRVEVLGDGKLLDHWLEHTSF